MSKDKLADELEHEAQLLRADLDLSALLRRAAATLRCEDGEMQKDVERLDYLESEAINEPPWPALFRKNVPITRAAIDAARAETLKESTRAQSSRSQEPERSPKE